MYENQNPNQQYEYSFRTQPSEEQQTPPQHPQKQHHNGNHFVKTFLTVVLCVILSFGAGVGGTYYAYHKLAPDGPADGTVVAPPSEDSLHNDNPEGLLQREDGEYSPFGSAGESAYAISDVVKMVENSVVVIRATVVTSNGWNTSEGISSGSGVIISEEGYILTCNHVVEGAKSVKVILSDGKSTYAAMLVGRDEKSDLAVLKIQPTKDHPLTAAKHGKSGYLIKGEHVVAIGNPLGTLGGTVTDGIISSTAREIATANGTMTLIQTNAAINSGNSGGGLFNLKGELIGIVNAKYAASGVEGLAFAIPIDSAYKVECDLIEFGYVRGIIDHGLSVLEINKDNFDYYNYTYHIRETGLYVISSKYNSELKNRDRILSVNGIKTDTARDFEKILESCKVGDVLKIEYERSSGKHQTEITLREYVPDGTIVDFPNP